MKLSIYLKQEGLSASKFADHVGMPASTITRILRGDRSPTLDVMRKIAAATEHRVSSIDDFTPVATDGEAA